MSVPSSTPEASNPLPGPYAPGLPGPLQGAHSPTPAQRLSFAASEWSYTCPERHSVPLGDVLDHLVPGGYDDEATEPAGRVWVDTDPDARRAYATVSCPCWPSVTAWRDGTTLGRTIWHHARDGRIEDEQAGAVVPGVGRAS